MPRSAIDLSKLLRLDRPVNCAGLQMYVTANNRCPLPYIVSYEMSIACNPQTGVTYFEFILSGCSIVCF